VKWAALLAAATELAGDIGDMSARGSIYKVLSSSGGIERTPPRRGALPFVALAN